MINRHRAAISSARWSLLLGMTLLVASLLTGGCALVARLSPGSTAANDAAQPTPTPYTLPASSNLAAPPAASVGLPPIAEVAGQVRPAVTFIATRALTLDYFQNPSVQEGAGSGAIFDTRGYIITNNHVVQDARNITVTLPDGRTFDKVTVIGADPQTDLAVLKIEGQNLPVARLGNSDNLHPGDWVIAIGNALGLEGGPTVTAGVVGALGRSISEPSGAALDDLIQTDAAINPGNSGGPLINLSGEIIGINTAIDTRGQGIGFSISINSAKPIVEELIQNGRVVRGQIGVNVTTVSPTVARQLGVNQNVKGVAIVALAQGGPAARAGLRQRDVITKINGKAVTSVRDLLAALRGKKPGDKVDVSYIRSGGDEQQLSVTLEDLSRAR